MDQPQGPLTTSSTGDPELGPIQVELLRETLSKHRFHEKILRDLGINTAQIHSPALAPAFEYKCRESTPLNTLIKVFLLGLPVDRGSLQAAFPSGGVDGYLQSGLLRLGDDQTIRSSLKIFPFLDHNFLCDFSSSGPGQVYCPGSDSRKLVQARATQRFDSALDLCTGTGIQAIMAAPHCRKVIGVDTNPRAVRMARLNLKLNGIDNVEFREGDLFQPVGTETFDLILANPPFVPSPDAGEKFRVGGSQGNEIFQSILAGVPSHLKEGGFCQIVTHLLEFENDSQTDFIRNFSRRQGWETLILTGAPFDLYAYAVDQYQLFIHRKDEYRHVVTGFLEHLEALGFRRGASVVITFRNSGQFRFEKILAYSAPVSFDLSPREKLCDFYGLASTPD